MSQPLPPPRRRASPFQPRFTITLFYLFGFFVLYALLLAAPALLEVFEKMPPGPEQEAMAKRVTQDALRAPRIWVVAGLALITTALGARAGWLPGARKPD
jgi:hypothetical protein